MKKTYVYVLIILVLCCLLAGLFRGKARPCAKSHVKASETLSTVGMGAAVQPLANTQAETVTPPTVVISNGVFVVDTREKLVYGTPAMEKYRAGDQRQAALHGAEAKVTLRVVDTEGKEVSDASVSLTFAFRQQNKPVTGLTDSNGLFVAQGTLTDDIIYRVTKAGYYETLDRFFMAKAATRCVENGRWIPWNPTLQVTLKEIHKPIPMYVKRVEIRLPKTGVLFGFDLQQGDLVEPYGRGKIEDIFFTCKVERSRSSDYLDFKKELQISTLEADEGVIRKNKEKWSNLVSIYEAPDSGYSQTIKLILDRTSLKIIEESEFSESEYLILRVRVRRDEKKKVIMANYGKIYGTIDYGSFDNDREGAGVSFTYYFNPTPNDRNLEFDGKNNLFNPKWNEPDSAIVQP